MFKRKGKTSKNMELHLLTVGGVNTGRTATSFFEVQSNKGNKVGTLFDSIEYMRELGVMQAIEMQETGINLAMLRLNKNESLIFDDSDFKEIKVTRIS